MEIDLEFLYIVCLLYIRDTKGTICCGERVHNILGNKQSYASLGEHSHREKLMGEYQGKYFEWLSGGLLSAKTLLLGQIVGIS